VFLEQVCGLCPPGWALTGSGCNSCPDQKELTPLKNTAISIFTVVCAVIWYFFSWRPLTSDSDTANSTDQRSSKCDVVALRKQATKAKDALKSAYDFLFKRDSDSDFWKDIVPLIAPYLKLYVTFFQILSSFMTFGVTWPPLLLSMMKWLKSTIFLDVLTLPGLSCLWNGVSFKSRLLTYTLAPLAVIFCLILPVCYSYLRSWCRNPRNGNENAPSKTHLAVVNAAWKNLMLWLFLIYPVVSLATLQAFNCQPLGLGKLAADFNEDCPEANNLLRVWSYFFIAIYPVGIPVFCYISMLSMGVHLVAKDMRNELILRALVMRFASFNEASTDNIVSNSDCKDGFCISKDLAVEILTFDFMERKQKPADGVSHSQPACEDEKNKDNADEQGSNSLTSCVDNVKQKCMPKKKEDELTQEQKRFWYQTIAQDETESKNLSIAIFQLANELLVKGKISIPTLSWHEHEKVNLKDKSEELIMIAKETGSQAISPEEAKKLEMKLKQAKLEMAKTYAIHPLLDDSHNWTFIEQVQTFIGSGSLNPSADWKSVYTRKNMKNHAVERVGFVFAAYRVDFWYWEMLEMLRK